MRWISLHVLSAVAAFFFFSAPTNAQELWRMDPDGIFRKVNPPVTSPSSVSRTEGISAPLQSSLDDWTVQPCSPPQVTALDPLPGTGSKSPTIGGKQPIKLELDEATLLKLKQLLDGKSPMPPVTINPVVPDSITQPLQRFCLSAEILVWLASALLSLFGLGKLTPWVAQAVRFLLSLRPAPSSPSAMTPEVPSSTQANPSSAGNQAVPSSVPKQGT